MKGGAGTWQQPQGLQLAKQQHVQRGGSDAAVMIRCSRHMLPSTDGPALGHPVLPSVHVAAVWTMSHSLCVSCKQTPSKWSRARGWPCPHRSPLCLTARILWRTLPSTVLICIPRWLLLLPQPVTLPPHLAPSPPPPGAQGHLPG